MDFDFQSIIDYLNENKQILVMVLLVLLACYYLIKEFCLDTVEGLITEEEVTKQIAKDESKFKKFLETFIELSPKNQDLISKKYRTRIQKILYCEGEDTLDDKCLSSSEYLLWRKSKDKNNLEGQMINNIMKIYKKNKAITVNDIKMEISKMIEDIRKE